MPKRKELKRIPEFSSEREEREFWETHDTADYVDWRQARVAVFPDLKSSTEAILTGRNDSSGWEPPFDAVASCCRTTLPARRDPRYNVVMIDESAGIVYLDRRIERAELVRLMKMYFGDMVKFVADIERGVIAVGGELHVDAEQLLLEQGSRQNDLWGGNYYPGKGRDNCIEFTALINIRPAQGNRSMDVQDPALRERIRVLALALIGEGEAL